MKSKKYIVAVSGGPDSMVALDMARKEKLDLIVAHVNYKQRDSADRDEKIVRDYCQRYDIPFFKSNYVNIEKSGNFQRDARVFRYDFFQKLQTENNADNLIVGHHKDDDIETYLFQKQRNMLSDYVGLAEKNKIYGFNVYRPLINMTKQDILEYCATHDITYGIDESNLETDYTRNKIRHNLAKLSKKEYDDIYNDLLAERKLWQEKQKNIEKIVKSWDLVIDYASYAKIDNVDRFLFLRMWLLKHGIEAYDFSEAYLKEIDRTIINKEANHQFQNKNLVTSYEEIALFEEISYAYKLENVSMLETRFFKIKDKGQGVQSVTLKSDDFPITIRNYKQGDKIEMHFGTKRVSRFFIDRKIPVYKRKNWPVIENSKGEVVFVSGLGADKRHYSNNPSFFMIEL